jgi:hypothetical protein
MFCVMTDKVTSVDGRALAAVPERDGAGAGAGAEEEARATLGASNPRAAVATRAMV